MGSRSEINNKERKREKLQKKGNRPERRAEGMPFEETQGRKEKKSKNSFKKNVYDPKTSTITLIYLLLHPFAFSVSSIHFETTSVIRIHPFRFRTGGLARCSITMRVTA